MKVYLIRHGQTLYNAAHICQGWCDVKLSENGENQAKELGENIKDIQFDKIIVSDLERAKQTARLIFGNDAEFEFDERLRELNNTHFAGRYSKDLREEYGERFIYAIRNFDYGNLGGESWESLFKRTGDFLKSLEKDESSEKIAVVTHGGTIYALLSNVLGFRVTGKLVHTKNCSVTTLELKDGTWRLETYNYEYKKLS